MTTMLQQTNPNVLNFKCTVTHAPFINP